MIDQDKMRALAKELRREYVFRLGLVAPEYRDKVSRTSADAADAIDLLLAELEAAAADKRDAERYRWLRDEDAGVPDGERELCVVQFRLPFTEAPDRDLFDVALDAAIDAALAQRQGEGS